MIRSCKVDRTVQTTSGSLRTFLYETDRVWLVPRSKPLRNSCVLWIPRGRMRFVYESITQRDSQYPPFNFYYPYGYFHLSPPFTGERCTHRHPPLHLQSIPPSLSGGYTHSPSGSHHPITYTIQNCTLPYESGQNRASPQMRRHFRQLKRPDLDGFANEKAVPQGRNRLLRSGAATLPIIYI